MLSLDQLRGSTEEKRKEKRMLTVGVCGQGYDGVGFA
jgi:hypothetical protein